MLCAFFGANITLAGCNDENSDEQSNELTPQELYQTSWRGTGRCAAWAVPNMEVGMQFIDTESGKVKLIYPIELKESLLHLIAMLYIWEVLLGL